MNDAIQAVAEEIDGYRGKRAWNDPFGGNHALNFEIYGHFTSPSADSLT